MELNAYHLNSLEEPTDEQLHALISYCTQEFPECSIGTKTKDARDKANSDRSQK